MVKIKKQLITSIDRIYGYNNKRKTVTVHQTGNTSKGADAQAHANLQSKGNVRQASWHWQVDDKQAIQSYDHSAQCWHAGDGRTGEGNLNSIAVEICINSDGDYKKAVKNGAELVKKILDDEGLTTKDIRQHYDWTKKDCPAQIRAKKDGISWDDFIDMVKGESSAKPSNSSKTAYTGNSIVDYLLSIGQSATFANRSKLAKKQGIKNYRGTADQNLKLLNALRGNKTTKQKTVKEMAREVIAGKHGIGHDNRRKSLGISKAEYEKVRKEVNKRMK